MACIVLLCSLVRALCIPTCQASRPGDRYMHTKCKRKDRRPRLESVEVETCLGRQVVTSGQIGFPSALDMHRKQATDPLGA